VLRQILVLLGGLCLLAACSPQASLLHPSASASPALPTLGLRTIAVSPVAYATYQPGEMCSAFIDEDLRSALVRELRRRSYEAFAVGGSVSRSFSAGERLPRPGEPPPAGLLPSPDTQGVLRVWIEEYFENTLCGWEGPKYLTIGAVGILYAGSPPQEVWRGRARVAEQGGYPARELMWLVTSRVSEALLQELPAAAGGELRR
jgi:hypothetical protein